MTKRMPTAAVSAMLLASAVAAGANPARAQGARGQYQQSEAWPQQGSIAALPAADLIDRQVKDSQGRDAGQISAVVLDNENGAVDFVVIGGSGNFDLNGQVVAVPWSVLQPPTSTRGAITLKISADKLAQAPRLNGNALAQLNEPGARANIYGYYGYPYPPPYAVRRGYGYYGYGASGAPAGTPYGGYGGGNGAYYGPGYGPPAYAGRAPGARQQGHNQTANGQGGANHNQMNETQRQLVENGLVVGPQGVAAALRSGTASSVNAMQSAGVVARNGDTIGRIDQVMLDPEHGEVAFVLVERGGFLGLNPSWFAMPIEALAWSPPANGYVLTVNDQLLNSEPPLPVNDKRLPKQVNRNELAQLYQHFGITPYWEQGPQQAGRNGAGAAGGRSGSSQRP